MDAPYVELPSGLIVPRAAAEQKARAEHDSFTGVSLFSGCGGFDVGFISAGCRVLAAIEYDCAAVHTYMANLCRWGDVKMHFVEPTDEVRMEEYLIGVFREAGLKVDKAGHIVADGKLSMGDFPRAGISAFANAPGHHGTPHVFIGDIRKLETKRVLDAIGLKPGEPDCVFGGPPCQGFSVAGRREVMDPRNSLVFEWCRFVVEMRPRSCVMENVPGIASMVTEAGIPVLDEICMVLEKGGFGMRDAFRRAVEQQMGVGFLRGPDKRRRAERDVEPDDDGDEQADLFSFAEAAD